MSEKKNLIQIYKDILSTAWMSANEKGVISRLIDPETGEKSPVMIEDNTDNKKKKTAVLPIKENLVGLDSIESQLVSHECVTYLMHEHSSYFSSCELHVFELSETHIDLRWDSTKCPAYLSILQINKGLFIVF